MTLNTCLLLCFVLCTRHILLLLIIVLDNSSARDLSCVTRYCICDSYYFILL